VELRLTDDGGYITERLPRRNGLIRPAIANIDQLVILCSQAPPVTDPYLIDKVTVVALYQGIQPIILLNKSDLHESGDLYDAYQKAGFPVIRASAVTGEGVQEITDLLAGKISAFTGNSAIGKSSILNRIDSRFGLQVGDMSEKIARGRHTTRHVELLRLENGGLVADTPGFSTFDAVRMEKLTKDNLQQFFPEIDRFFAQCRFTDCKHIKEPGCVVREAVERGEIAKSRYESYCMLYEEVAAQKLWK
jgi:ribosome biogenesis GTPase